MASDSFTILIAGDFVINQKYGSIVLDERLINFFRSSDLNVVNLEAPVTEGNSKIIKTGPHLRSEKYSTATILKKLEVDIVTLANNHVLDYDEQGIKDTFSFCDEHKIQVVGAGINLEQASKVLYVDTQQGKIAIVNFAENEWSIATESSPGANPMDLVANVRTIKEAKKNSDFVFVIVHGGHEYYNLPSPRMQNQYRFYAENGADIVIGHHTHCIGGFENYAGVPIYYSLGNFLFTKSSSYDDWYLGLVLEVTIAEGLISSRLHPVKQERDFSNLSFLSVNEANDVHDRIDRLNNIIEDPSKLIAEWNRYIESKSRLYRDYLSPLVFLNNKYLKAFFRKFSVNFSNTTGVSYLLNLMRCEAHYEVSKEVLRRFLKK